LKLFAAYETSHSRIRPFTICEAMLMQFMSTRELALDRMV
jgi:hypothetical protein